MNLRPEEPWIAVGALGPSLLRRDFAMCHIAWVICWLQHYLILFPTVQVPFHWSFSWLLSIQRGQHNGSPRQNNNCLFNTLQLQTDFCSQHCLLSINVSGSRPHTR
jgi:hypothetical protein